MNDLSAEELYRLAKQRQREEEAQRKLQTKEQVKALQARLKALDDDHRKKVLALEAEQAKARAVVEAELAQLTGNPIPAESAQRQGISSQILAIIQAHGELSSKDLQVKLQEQGVTPRNLNQTLSYLKRRG
jgi:hypothetical protein